MVRAGAWAALAVLVLGIPSVAPAAAPADAPVWGAPVVVDPTRDGQEPSLLLAPDGTVYVAAPSALTARSCRSGWLWRSDDGGETFTPLVSEVPGVGCSRGVAIGGGDSDLALAARGRLLYADLSGADVSVAASDDRGSTWTSSTPLGSVVPGADRQWIAADGDTVYLLYHQCVVLVSCGAGFLVSKSLDGGVTFPFVFPATHIDDADSADLAGPLVVGADGSLSFPFFVVTKNKFEVRVATSHDGALTWQESTIAIRAYDPRHVFPILATDDAGDMYVTWAEERWDGHTLDGYDLFEAHSTDAGSTWSTPRRLTSGPGSAEEPWIVAGAPGRVAIAYYGTDDGRAHRDGDAAVPDDARYLVRVAYSFDALDATPTWAVTDADGTPVLVGMLGRELYDFLTIRMDPAGRLALAYARQTDAPGGDSFLRGPPVSVVIAPAVAWRSPAMFAKQVDGPLFR